MESAFTFICCLSPPPAEWKQEETRDEECKSLSDDHMPVTQCFSRITLTVGDAPKLMLIKTLSRESLAEQVISKCECSCFSVASLLVLFKYIMYNYCS